MPPYVEPVEPVAGVSFLEAQQLNDFHCCHCGWTHDTYVGAMFNRIPQRTLAEVRALLERLGLAAEDVPGLIDAIYGASATEESDVESGLAVEQGTDEAGYDEAGAEDENDREETIRWLEAQLEQEAADGERRAEELRSRKRRVRELETQLAGYLSPFGAFPGGCGVDLVAFSSSGSVPDVAVDYAQNGHRVFVLDRGDDVTNSAHTRELAPSLYTVLLPATTVTGGDESEVGKQFAALDEFCRRAAIGRAIAFVDDPTWSDLAMAAQSRLGWRLVFHLDERGGERLPANSDLVVSAGAAERATLREQIEEQLAGWHPRAVIVVVSFDNPDYLATTLESVFAHALTPTTR